MPVRRFTRFTELHPGRPHRKNCKQVQMNVNNQEGAGAPSQSGIAVKESVNIIPRDRVIATTCKCPIRGCRNSQFQSPVGLGNGTFFNSLVLRKPTILDRSHFPLKNPPSATYRCHNAIPLLVPLANHVRFMRMSDSTVRWKRFVTSPLRPLTLLSV